MDVFIWTSCLGHRFYVSYLLAWLLARTYRDSTLAWAHEGIPLANLVRWKDKPVPLSIVQARPVGPLKYRISILFVVIYSIG
jgi:photosystem I P700 chlorophyll a apoprotein A2